MRSQALGLSAFLQMPIDHAPRWLCFLVKESNSQLCNFNMLVIIPCNNSLDCCVVILLTILCFMHGNNFSLHTSQASTTYGSLLDHFWTTLPFDHVKLQISEAYWTDHYAIFLSIPLKIFIV